MNKLEIIYGFRKFTINLLIKLAVFLHFFPKLLIFKISLTKFYRLMKRLLFFISKLQHNKFISINGKLRLNLYIPGWPSKAFYTSCYKFAEFENKLPCATVLISVTSACAFRCPHCYQRLDKGADVEIIKLQETVKSLQNKGVSFFNIEGGEPFMAFDRLKAVCNVIDDRAEIWVNSTGFGITLEKLQELEKYPVKAIMFPYLSSDPKKIDSFMGRDDAYEIICNGIKLCNLSNIPAALNVCLMKADLLNGELLKILKNAKEMNICYVQLIHPKQAGAWLENHDCYFSEDDLKQIRNEINRYNLSPQYRDLPPVSSQIIEEEADMFGCTAGGTDRFYINAKGDVQPCEFLNLSFGNLVTEPFEQIYEKMRSNFKIPGEKWLCQAYASEIQHLKEKSNLNILPLNPEISKEITANWDRGNPTKLYQLLENRRK